MFGLNRPAFVSRLSFVFLIDIFRTINKLKGIAFGPLGHEANDGFRIIGNTQSFSRVDRIQVRVVLQPAFHLGA